METKKSVCLEAKEVEEATGVIDYRLDSSHHIDDRGGLGHIVDSCWADDWHEVSMQGSLILMGAGG